MHITDWLEMLGEHFPLVVIGCARIKNGTHSGGQKGVSVWKKYRAWDGAQPFETVLRTKNGEWAQTQGLDPFTQSAAYYRLTGDAPEANTVEVSVQNASRDAVYAPASMEKVTDGDVHERRDALLKGRGLFGTRNYTVTEVLGTRPSELMVAESWVSSPQTEEQTAYAEAESVYRSFVYDAYTAADEDLLPVLNRLFGQDYDDENDGVYSALSRIREVLKAQVRYSETAEAAPDNADPIAYFLTDSRKGNAVLMPRRPCRRCGRTAFPHIMRNATICRLPKRRAARTEQLR